MTYEEELSESTALSPDEAFAAVGNKTRVRILQTLGEADGPLSFTDLRDRVGIRQGGQFNYHLERLMDHFVRKSDDGYELRQAGRHVVQAVLSGAATDAPVVEWTRIDQLCPYCEAPIEVRYHQGHVEQFCTECSGTFGRDDPSTRGYLGCLMLPPAGLRSRTTEEAVRAGWIWQQMKLLAVASGICPCCSADLDWSVNVCEGHDATEGLCDECDWRYAVRFHYACTNCIFDGEGTSPVALAANTDLLAFLTAHSLNPVFPTRVSRVRQALSDYDEVVRSTDPFEAEFTFTVDGDALVLTVDDDLSVVDVTERRAAETV